MKPVPSNDADHQIGHEVRRIAGEKDAEYHVINGGVDDGIQNPPQDPKEILLRFRPKVGPCLVHDQVPIRPDAR